MVVTNTNVVGLNKKICLFADIHFNVKYNTKKFDKIIENVIANKPDYICIVGDILDSSELENLKDINKLYSFIARLASISKVIISLGNHDITVIKKRRHCGYRYPSEFVNNIKKINNVIFLDNEMYIDNSICFIGYTESLDLTYNDKGPSDIAISELNALLNDLDETKFNVMLSHNPLHVSKDIMYKSVKNYSKLNLILSGHTHNGLLPTFIKTNTVLISPNKRFFVHRARGHFKNKVVDVIVTGGVVKFSYGSGFFRFFNFLFPIDIDYID